MGIIPADIFFENIEQLISEGKDVEVRCFGGSMNPYLRGDGSEALVVSPFSPEELTPGAIVAFCYQGKYLCHRIIRRDGEKLLIQGDGLIKEQEQVLVSDIIGIVRTVIRRNGKPVSTQSKMARLYWRCWSFLSPIQKYLLFFYRVMCKIKVLLHKFATTK